MTSYFGVAPIVVAGWMAIAVAVIVLGLLVLAAFNRILLKMALRNIPRRRAQTVLILFGLMLATLIITASFGVGDTLGYSLEAISLRQIGGIDGAFTLHPDQTVQGASTAPTEWFTDSQAKDVVTRIKADPGVQDAQALIVAPGSMTDTTTNQVTSENVAIFGVAPGFRNLWGDLRSKSGKSLDPDQLAADHVFLGNSLAARLDAHTGDNLQLFIDGHPVTVVVSDILNTEVNPSISRHGPIVSSVLIPIDTVRTALTRPSGANIVYVRFKGSGGLDDLGPSGSMGQAITRRFRADFTDPVAAAELKDFLNTPAVHAQLVIIRDQGSFLNPGTDLAKRLLVELAQPGVTDEFKALAGDAFTQFVIARAVIDSLPKNATATQQQAATEEIGARLASLQVDTASATNLKALLQRPEVRRELDKLVALLPRDGPAKSVITDLLIEAGKPELTPKFRATVGNADFQAQMGQTVAAVAPAQLSAYNDIATHLDLYTFASYKQESVLFSQAGGLGAAGALLGVSFFSLAVGVLLIFLIFVMLAAERRAEMGMSRALGLKRRHLTQMFLFEGTAYTLAASVVGVIAGIGVGQLMISVLSSVFTGLYKGLQLEYHVEWTSLVVAICLGILLTFVVIAFSAYRVSRLNIVAAIRDLDESEHRDAGIRQLFTAVFKIAAFAFKQLFKGKPLVFLGRITLGTLGAIWTFWWSLFKRGPMTIALGLLLMKIGLNNSIESLSLYSAGISFVIIGAGLAIKWLASLTGMRLVIASRIGFTAAAFALLIYWGRPFGQVEKLIHVDGAIKFQDLRAGPEMFAITALMVLLGVIWLVMYNSDILIAGVMFFTSRVGSLAPITRTSMAYPMSTKFRTGMAVAMFAIVTFMIVYMSIFKDVLLQNFGQVDQSAGGWQVVAGAPDFQFQSNDKTVFPADVASLVRADSKVSAEIRGVGWENSSHSVSIHQVGSKTPISRARFGGAITTVRVVDDGYLEATTYAVKPRADGYASDRAVWDAVKSTSGFVVLDTAKLDAQGSSAAVISGAKSSDATFKPFQIEISNADPTAGATTGPLPTVTVIGFIDKPLWDGMYMSTRTADQLQLFAPTGTSPTAKPTLGNTKRPLVPQGYYFAIKPGVNVNAARLDLGRMLVKDQLEPVSVADQVALQLSATFTLLNLITGFLALGLIVGIAGLGVISTRAVVERWQQIGMLRALGYRRSLVQTSFLMESSLIAIIGLVIGSFVGVWQSYRFFVTEKSFGTVTFHVPVVELILILVGAYLATLVTTFLPARAAARIAPAEALRCE